MNSFKKKIYALITLSLCITAMHAAMPRFDVSLKHTLSTLKGENGLNRIQSQANTDDEITHFPVMIEITEDEEADSILKSLDAVVYHHRGSIYLTSIPVEKLEEMSRYAGVNNFQLSDPSAASLDVARNLTHVDAVHQHLNTIESVNYPQNRHIVTGICDIGFDPRHEVFRNSLMQWVIYDEYHGKRTLYDGYNDITANAPATDNIEYTHATHVGNILAGYNDGSPYYGVAPATDFIATTSSLSHVGICSGIEDVIAYGKSTGKPVVVNISAGSYLGPHDGCDLVGRYLSAMSEDAVICFSSGNYGQRNNCLSLNLDDYDDYIGSTWSDASWNSFDVSGGTDIWCSDDAPVEVRLCVWDIIEHEFKYISDWMGGAEEGNYFLDLESTPWFTSGGVWVSWGIYEHNNRYNVAFEYDYSTAEMQLAGPWARYIIGFHIRKTQANTHVDVYSDGIKSFLHGHGMKGALRGNADGSVSNLSSCPDVVSVGAWNSRSIVPDVTVGMRDCGFDTQCVMPFTAWGTSGDGRRLPHFCAPGNVLVGALSTPHHLTEGDKGDANHVVFDHDGYKYFATGGTSMSSPFAAGIFALWLSVNPRLTVYDLVDIAQQTADRSFADIDNPRWGAGAIDAYAGLVAVEERLKNEGVNDLPGLTETMPSVYIQNGNISVSWPGVDKPTIEIYDLTGRKIGAKTPTHNQLLIIKVTDPDTSATHTFKLR